ncbi:hypothetical protein BS47DRAFT_36440 [Hydnum rufescens UP504]|uniref:Uncharacterized protein n=1 Tax=Hydnum rufescens UP504 TaxID=1448309 RepID=A0A9P6AS27_9AGAM|nr:hypothetical protein BS47DRAFT_36440 [Hydnum rufescens UP504]
MKADDGLHPYAFFQFAADPIAATVVSNLRYLVLEIPREGNIRALSLFSNLEELVLDLRPEWIPQAPDSIESDFFEIFKSCPRLRKVVLFLYNNGWPSRFAIRFYRRMGAEEDWELTREDVDDLRRVGLGGPLARRRHRFPAMVCVS